MATTFDAALTNCRTVRSKREAFAVFRRWASPRIISVGLTVVVVARLIVGSWSWWDLAAAGIVIAANPFTEWMIHLHILHGESIRIGSLDLGNGDGHREHHKDPGEIQWLLLAAVDAAVFQVMVAILVVGLTLPPLWLLGAPLLAPVLTAVVLGIAKLLEYEWDHFLFHTSYQPRTRWYRRLKRNHRLHHWRNEHYWLGVTVNLADRVLGTYPRSRSDVPLSPTARTLGSDPEDS